MLSLGMASLARAADCSRMIRYIERLVERPRWRRAPDAERYAPLYRQLVDCRVPCHFEVEDYISGSLYDDGERLVVLRDFMQTIGNQDFSVTARDPEGTLVKIESAFYEGVAAVLASHPEYRSVRIVYHTVKNPRLREHAARMGLEATRHFSLPRSALAFVTSLGAVATAVWAPEFFDSEVAALALLSIYGAVRNVEYDFIIDIPVDRLRLR